MVKFFEFFVHTKNEVRRGVCFSPQKRSYLLELSSRKQGVVFERIQNDKDLIINQNTLIKEVNLDFEKIEQQFQLSTLREVSIRIKYHDLFYAIKYSNQTVIIVLMQVLHNISWLLIYLFSFCIPIHIWEGELIFI